MKKILLLAALLSIPAINIPASGIGTSGGLTLLEPTSAKMQGLAGAGTALSGSVEVMLYNPAGMAGVSGQEVVMMYRRGFDGEAYISGLYGRDFKVLNAGMAVQYYSTGKITLYNTSGEEMTEEGQKDIVLTAGTAMQAGVFPVGVNLKLILTEIFGEKASAVAADAGIQYVGPVRGVKLGLSARNLGTELKFKEVGDNLPTNIAAGASYRAAINEGHLNVALEFPYYLNEETIYGLLGIEYSYGGFGKARLGYRRNLADNTTDVGSLKLGAGITWNHYSLDYSIGLAGDLDMPHNLSLKIAF